MNLLNLAMGAFQFTTDSDALILEEGYLDIVRGNLLEKTFSDKEALNERASVCKLYAEGADFDRMVAFYEESAPETSKTVIKKKSLIKQAWDAICKFFRNIKEKYFKKKIAEIPSDAEFVVPAETVKEVKEVRSKSKEFIAAVKRFAGKVKNSKAVVAVLSALCSIKRAVKNGFSKIKGKFKMIRANRKAKKDAKKEVPAGSVVLSGSEVKEIVNDLSSTATELENLASTTLPNDEMAAVDELHDVTGKASPESKTFTPSEINDIHKAQVALAEIDGSSAGSEVTNNVDACREVRVAVSDMAGELKTVAVAVIPTDAELSSGSADSDTPVNESGDDGAFVSMAQKAAATAMRNRKQ